MTTRLKNAMTQTWMWMISWIHARPAHVVRSTKCRRMTVLIQMISSLFGVEEADPVCVKIQDLLRQGKLSKESIFDKYLNDVLEIMYNPFHEYDRKVVEFFNTITYLGGKRTTCFVRGPMNLGDSRNSHMKLTDKRMNLGGIFGICLCQVSGWIYPRIRSYQAFIFRSYGTIEKTLKLNV